MSAPIGMMLRTGSSATNTHRIPSAASGTRRRAAMPAPAHLRVAPLDRGRVRPRPEARCRRQYQGEEAEEQRRNGGVVLGEHAERERDERRRIAPARLGARARELETTERAQRRE